MRYLTQDQVLELHVAVIERSGGGDAESLILGVAAGVVSRDDLVNWLRAHVIQR